MKKTNVSTIPQDLRALALDRDQQKALKGGQGDFIIIDDLQGI